MDGVVDLSLIQIAASYVFVLIALLIIRIRKINREREMIISSIRMTLQLMLTGYVLVYVFKYPNPFITLVIIVLMEAFSIFTVLKKFKGKLSKDFKKIIALSMMSGTLSTLFFFLFVVVQVSPWYEPRYFIPIAGMLIGNSMTGISLGVKSLIEGMEIQKSLIEESLILGATPKTAARTLVNNSFDSAIMPTINSMIGMGIVFLPGMMTGQILSGTNPQSAIAYQIAIMFGILGACSITIMIMLQLGYKTFFNKQAQMIID